MKRILLSFFGLVSARQSANELKIVQAKLDTAYTGIRAYEKDREFTLKHIADQKATIDTIIEKTNALVKTSDNLIADQKLMIAAQDEQIKRLTTARSAKQLADAKLPFAESMTKEIALGCSLNRSK